MKLSEDYSPGTKIIQAYEGNKININGQNFSRSLVVSNYQIIDDWPLNDIQQLAELHLQPILDLEPEVILIGTGTQLVFPPPHSYAAIIKQGIGIEFMDSVAVCRTYNILLSEERKVAAGIIL